MPADALSDAETVAARSQPDVISSKEAVRNGRRLLREVVPRHWRLILVSFGCIIGVASFTGGLAASTRLIVDDVFSDGDAAAALWVALLVFGITAAKSFFQYANTVIRVVLQRSVSVSYQKRLFAHVLRQDMAFFGTQHPSTQMLLIQMYGQSSGRTVAQVLNQMLVDGLTVVALFVVMLIQDPLLTVIASLAVPPIIGLVAYLSKRIRTVSSAEMGAAGMYFSIGSEVLKGIKTVKSFQLERKSNRRFRAALKELEQRAYMLARISSATIPIMEFLAGLVIGLFVMFASWQISTSDATAGQFTAFITAFLMAYQPAERFSNSWVQVQQGLVFVQRMYDLLDKDISDKRYGNEAFGDLAPEISLDNVSFSYGSHSPALKDISLAIRAGERVAVVGRSGAGKSTLIDVLQRFQDPQKGEVRIGGLDLRQLSREALHESIAYISQDVFLFDSTIADNIAVGNPAATREDIQQAAERAQLGSLIAQLPKGVDTPIGPNGNALSGGQRQRIAIARGILKDAKVYIFDEITSALDGQTEREVMTELTKALTEATLIFITHRASTLDYVDRVIVLKDGQLQGFDTPDGLQRDSAEFRVLFNAPEPDPGLE